MAEKTANEMIEGIISSDLPTSDQLYMFVQLCDEKVLMKELGVQAIATKVGIQEPSPLTSFAYGVLRIAKPWLFEKGGEA